MQTIDLGKLRFAFRGQWNAGTTYEINDCAAYGGNVYVYASILNTAGNLPTDTTYWQLMLQGVNFRGSWSAAAAYRIGDLVEYGGVSYLSRDDNTNQAPSSSSPHWAVLAEGFRWMGAFSTATNYDRNDIVQYGGVSYIAGADILASPSAPSSGGSWAVFANGVNPTGAWSGGTNYKKNDLAQYGGATYLASADVAAGGGVPSANAAWTVFSSGVNFLGQWALATNYKKSDLVQYGGTTYAASADIAAGGAAPSANAAWTVFSAGINFTGIWAAAAVYKKGDAVTYNGSSYVAAADIAANQPAPGANATWAQFTAGINLTGEWNIVTVYRKNDLVTYGGSCYWATADVGAAAGRPPVNPTWQVLAGGLRLRGPWAAGAVYLKNDIVTNAGSAYVAVSDHTASGTFNADAAMQWQAFASGGSLVGGYGMPAVPPAGQFQFGARKHGGRTFAEITGDDGIVSKLMLSEMEKSIIQIQPNITTTLSLYGNTTTNVGTVATPAISVADWRRRTTFTVAGASTGHGFYVTVAPFLRGNAAGMGGLFLYMRFSPLTAGTAGNSFFAGIGPVGPLVTGAPSGMANLFGVAYDPSDSNVGNFSFISNNGAGAQTKQDLGAAMSRANPTHIYDLYIWSAPSPDAGGAALCIKVVNVTTGATVIDTSVAGNAGPALGVLLTPRLQGFDVIASATGSLAFYGLYAEGP